MNLSRTIEQLEANPWPAAPAEASPMVIRCHALRKVPVSQLSVGDVRVLPGQEIGTRFLIPVAVKFLEEAPLVEGDHYPGDLLLNVLRLESNHWKEEQELLQRVAAVARRAQAELPTSEEAIQSSRATLREINAFLRSTAA
jgi:hypothetical protein